MLVCMKVRVLLHGFPAVLEAGNYHSAQVQNHVFLLGYMFWNFAL